MPENITVPRVMLAAPRSGSGKTTVTMGLAAWFSRQLNVKCFKVGPDYIDPTYIGAGAGCRGVNLDSWMLDRRLLCQAFYRGTKESDLALVEGVMGLFDGKGSGPCGSSAQVARWLKIPIILVVDAAGTSRSLAALVSGFLNFDPRINVAGVFLNRVGSDAHHRSAKLSIERMVKIPVVGYLPRDPAFDAPSRHLGLIQRPGSELTALAARIAQTLARTADGEAILQIAANRQPVRVGASREPRMTAKGIKIGVARDEAFSFYYDENFSVLEELGAELIFFSPLDDRELPAGIDGLVFGGGWPELCAERLAANQSMRRAVRDAADRGLPVYAECGGLIYLAKTLTVARRSWPMAGVLPATAAMNDKKQALGYRKARFSKQTILGDKGISVRGHEFHWSTIDRPPGPGFEPAYVFEDGRHEGFASENVLASYLHLNWLSDPELAENFLRACQGRKCA